MAKLPYIELANGLKIPILHEDRNVIAIDKPQGWMLAPVSWQNTSRNLFAALTSSVSAGDFWARSRNLKFIRFVHRLDAETSGVLLLVKAPGAVPAYTELFEDRKVHKVYLAVVKGVPEVIEWKCRLRIAPTAERAGVMEINNAQGKDSETLFRVIDKRADRALVMCWPLTGRTHQIRLHLAAVGHPVLGDELYGGAFEGKPETKLALRSIKLAYKDPFLAEMVYVTADAAAFVKANGFDPANQALKNTTAPDKVLEHPKARLEETRRVEKEVRKQQREAQRAVEQEQRHPEDRPPRSDWQRDERAGRFTREQSRERGERPARPRDPRRFNRDARQDSRFSDRPPRPFTRGEKPYGRKPFGSQHGEGAGRERSYGDRPQRRSGFGGKPFGPRKDYAERDARRPFGPRGPRKFERRGAQDDARSERLQTRTGVFQSSAKSGLKAGFRDASFSARPERRPFRSAAKGGYQKGKFGGSFAQKGKSGGGKYGRPSSSGRGGGGGRPARRGFNRGPR